MKHVSSIEDFTNDLYARYDTVLCTFSWFLVVFALNCTLVKDKRSATQLTESSLIRKLMEKMFVKVTNIIPDTIICAVHLLQDCYKRKDFPDFLRHVCRVKEGQCYLSICVQKGIYNTIHLFYFTVYSPHRAD